MAQTFGIIGSGSWATALAKILDGQQSSYQLVDQESGDHQVKFKSGDIIPTT